MSARLPLDLRQGITNEVHAWFALCAGMPGYAIEPRSLSISGVGDWSGFVHSIRTAAFRTPYESIGDYMNRWWYLPEINGERARLHQTLRSDEDRDLHDHPWPFVSIILAGGYTEELEICEGPSSQRERHRYRPGDVLFRHAEHRHRLDIEEGNDCWSLVLTAPNAREWGFWTPGGFVPWRQYTVKA